ncbi:hypothetical protein ACSLPI_26690, partial [Escherichia coli]
GEVLLILSGAALAAASEGLFVFVHSGFRDKGFPCGEQRRGLSNWGKTILQVCCFWFAAS